MILRSQSTNFDLRASKLLHSKAEEPEPEIWSTIKIICNLQIFIHINSRSISIFANIIHQETMFDHINHEPASMIHLQFFSHCIKQPKRNTA